MDQLDYKNRQLSLAEGLSRKQAERYLKANLSNVEIMKNRIKALSSQAEYNQYRQKYQSAKIQRHHEIHQELIRQKAEVKAVLGSRDDTLIKKQAKQKMNKQIKQKLNEALDKMKKSRIDQYRELKEKSQQNYQILSKRRLRELQAKRQKKEEVAKMETSIKLSLFRYSEEKKNELKTLKELQKKSMLQLNEHVNRQLAQLSNKQKDLINLSSSSFKASRVLDQQYTNLYEHRSFGKDIKLPGIKKSLDSKKTATNNTQ